MTFSQAPSFRWLEPWEYEPALPEGGLEVELQREVGPDHSLYQLVSSIRAIARRHDQDDVLFAIHEGTDEVLQVVEVHLTWSLKTERVNDVPWVTFRGSFEQWVEKRMKPDHQEWISR